MLPALVADIVFHAAPAHGAGIHLHTIANFLVARRERFASIIVLGAGRGASSAHL